MRTALLMAGLVFTILPPPAGPTPDTRTPIGVITGIITADHGAAVSGARISAGNVAASSATDGSYRLEGIPVGEVTLRVVALGYQPSTRTVRVGQGLVTTADFILVAAPFTLDELSVTATGHATVRKLGVAASAASPAGRRWNTEEYRHIAENAWRSPTRYPLSTFSSDVDAASMSNVRRHLRQGGLPPKDAVRVEEMINYFRYDYPAPDSRHPVSITTELADAPWHPGHKLLRIGLQTRRIPMEALPPNNLVFLLDVSGSMHAANKLPLVKSAFRLLVDQLRPEDRVAIVVYAGATGLVLAPTSDRTLILDALARLEAGGSTAGAAGLRLAYQTARESFLPEGNNRVILATDGDFNVGVSSDGELTRLIEQEREHGIYLTVLGFGMGNLKDSKLELLADKGNGHYAYVDDLMEARKVFVQELGATLLTVAKDVKLQVEFNPARVAAYRLVGYENRLLADEDFNDDAKDAGEMGAGHSVTALYQIVPVGVAIDVPLGTVDPLIYQTPDDRPATQSGGGAGADWLTVKVRYKLPSGGGSRLLTHRVVREAAPSADFRWAAAVAGVGMLLRDSEYRGQCTWEDVLSLAHGARGADPEGYRAEFIRLIETARGLAAASGDQRPGR